MDEKLDVLKLLVFAFVKVLFRGREDIVIGWETRESALRCGKDLNIIVVDGDFLPNQFLASRDLDGSVVQLEKLGRHRHIVHFVDAVVVDAEKLVVLLLDEERIEGCCRDQLVS